MIRIDVCNRQNSLAVDESLIREQIETIARDEKFEHGEISVAIVTDGEMHGLNREHLDHDYPTDVLSFVWASDGRSLDGEIIVSADTAIRAAHDFGWSAADELLLYIVHGTLHLTGYRDKSQEERHQMQEREAHYLRLRGKTIPREGQPPRSRAEEQQA